MSGLRGLRIVRRSSQGGLRGLRVRDLVKGA